MVLIVKNRLFILVVDDFCVMTIDIRGELYDEFVLVSDVLLLIDNGSD